MLFPKALPNILQLWGAPLDCQECACAWDPGKVPRMGEEGCGSSGAGPGSWADSRRELMLAQAQLLGVGGRTSCPP